MHVAKGSPIEPDKIITKDELEEELSGQQEVA
jgi:hypothetical protein